MLEISTILSYFSTVVKMQNIENMEKIRNITPSIHDLPKDILNIIAGNLSYDDIIQLCQTNKRFADRCRQDDFWETLLLVRYGDYIHPEDVSPREMFYNYEMMTNVFITDPKQGGYIYLTLNDDDVLISCVIGFLLEAVSYNDLGDISRMKTWKKVIGPRFLLRLYNEAHHPESGLLIVKPGGRYVPKEEWSQLIMNLPIVRGRHPKYNQIDILFQSEDYELTVRMIDLGDLFIKTLTFIIDYFGDGVEVTRIPVE